MISRSIWIVSLTHTVMIYSYRLIHGRFARPDRKIVAFRVCDSLVWRCFVFHCVSNFCAPFKISPTINDHIAIHPRTSSWIRSILFRSEQAILISRFIRAAENMRFKDLFLSLFLYLFRGPNAILSACRSIRECWNKSEEHGIMWGNTRRGGEVQFHTYIHGNKRKLSRREIVIIYSYMRRCGSRYSALNFHEKKKKIARGIID